MCVSVLICLRNYDCINCIIFFNTKSIKINTQNRLVLVITVHRVLKYELVNFIISLLYDLSITKAVVPYEAFSGSTDERVEVTRCSLVRGRDIVT